MPAYSNRTAKGTPFATDFASAWLVVSDGQADAERIQQYAQVIRLAGIEWVRERAEASRINPQKGEFDFAHPRFSASEIKGQNLNILEVFHDTPAWAKGESGNLCENLTDIYEFMYNTVKGMDGKADAWEIWNEEDEQLFAAEPADVYAAYFKAAAIGAADGNPNVLKTFGGLSQNPEYSGFTDLLLQNGILSYTDIYNYHTHVRDDSEPVQPVDLGKINAQIGRQNAYSGEALQTWVTEAGIYEGYQAGAEILTMSQLKKQARYAVTSTVESLAAGTDKHFWFIMPYYEENSGEYGAFTVDDMPKPAYAAMAVMTNVLGEAVYRGTAAGLPETVNGYVFANGEQECMVLWDTAGQTTVEISSQNPVQVIDLMGRTMTVIPVDGSVTVTTGYDPIYVISEEAFAESVYLPVSYQEPNTQPKQFTDAQKLVMVLEPEAVNYTDAKIAGYRIEKEDILPLAIYNFSDRPLSGTLWAVPEFEGSVTAEQSEFTVLPGEKQIVEFEVKAGDVMPDYPYDLAFEAIIEGEAASPSVCHIVFPYPASKQDEIVLFRSGSDLPSGELSAWDTENRSGGTFTAEQGQDGESLTFTVNFPAAGDNWFYPALAVTQSSNPGLDTSAGMTVTVTAARSYTDVSLNVMVWCGSERLYFLGTDPYPLMQGTHTYYFPWDRFLLHSGQAEDVPIQPEDISMLCIGCGTQAAAEFSYTVGQIGYYRAEETPAPEQLILSGISDGAVLKSGQIPVPSVLLSEGILPESIRWLVNGQEISPVEIQNLPRGKYRLDVSGRTKTHFAAAATVTFTVQ